MIVHVYQDAMSTLLARVGNLTRTILVLGQTGSECWGKRVPRPLSEVSLVPHQSDNPESASYGWSSVVPRLWQASIDLVRTHQLQGFVQIVDARKLLMSAVNAHYGSNENCSTLASRSTSVGRPCSLTNTTTTCAPSCKNPDCLHFCMNSAAVNSYLDLFRDQRVI